MAETLSTSRTRISLDQVHDLVEQYGEESVVKAVEIGLGLGMQAVLADVVSQKMSGQLLGVVTGTARRSIRVATETLRDRVRGIVGSPLRYVRAHEEGFKGTVEVAEHKRTMPARAQKVPSHTRKIKASVQTIAKHTRTIDGVAQTVREHVRRVSGGSQTVRSHVRNLKGGVQTVKKHNREMNIRARYFIRQSILDKQFVVRRLVIRELKALAKTQTKAPDRIVG